ncbi:MAG TPA: phosphomannomutase/phosphoglucomutase [Chromatiaceae bacterium]|nr:phosphomannomutase/phosphoglucomutase [Chromatiaceae bacterium]
MLGKKKKVGKDKNAAEEEKEAVTEQTARPVADDGRSYSMLYYFIPAFILAVLLVAALVAAQSWLSNKQASEKLKQSAAMVGSVVQKYASAVVHGKSELVRLAASRPGVLQAVREGEQAMDEVDRLLQETLPDVLLTRLLPAKDWDDEKVQQELFGSYAAADMYQRVREKSAPVPVEALKDSKGKVYFLVAMPVKDGDELAGVLFATFPFALVSRGLNDVPFQGVSIRMEQDTGMPLLYLGSGIAGSGGSMTVPGTLWHVNYVSAGFTGVSIPVLAGMATVVAVLLVLSLLWSYRRLQRDYQMDMGMTVTLVDATLKRLGAPTHSPRLKESIPAIEMLTRYAQATRTASVKAEHEENKAGRSHLTVDDLQRGQAQEHEACSLSPEQLPETLFRANVIRGLSESDLSAEIAQAIGLVVGTMVQEAGGDSLLVARDNRRTSSEYASSVIAGALASGCDVVDLEIAPMPLVSFTARTTSSTSSVMVTGGHNPADFNGFKITVDGKPLGQAQLLEIRERILNGDCRQGMGSISSRDMRNEYIHAVSEDVQLIEGMKVVLDCGNGIAGSLAVPLLEGLGCEVIPLFCDPDASFPHHLPDPSNTDNLKLLCAEVQKQGADIGVALDADGDALAVVDEKGRAIAADEVIMKLGSDIIRRHPGADVIYDVACSANLPAVILASGGRPIMWKTGHADLQEKLMETSGMLAGEMSGHIYIQERWFGFDDGIYAAARLLEILALESTPVSEAFAEYHSEFSTSLLQLVTPPGRARQIVAAMKHQGEFGEADVVDLDGLRVEYGDSWGLARASKTQPALILRFEASSKEALEEIQSRFRTLLTQIAPELPLPF